MAARTGSDAQWPPRSPHEALRGTPSGREKLRLMSNRTSPSPSPSKRTTRDKPVPQSAIFDNGELDVDVDGDEDEETLQLKLQAIQARLKLKKLQNAKTKKELDRAYPESNSAPAPILSRRPSAHGQTRETRTSADLRPGSLPQPDVQVPASPVRKAQMAEEQTSPSRVRLGIDKGLKGRDMSLKRAPSLRKMQQGPGEETGGYLRRAHTLAQPNGSTSTQERPKTFAERLAAARCDEVEKQARQERVKQARSGSSFRLGEREIEDMKATAEVMPEEPSESTQYTREDIVSGTGASRNNTLPRQTPRPQNQVLQGKTEFSSTGTSDTRQQTSSQQRHKKVAPGDVPEVEASAFEPFSSVHLSKRIIPHPVLTRNLTGKKTYVLQDIMKHVKAPNFELPEVEQDIVVFAIVASKSDARSHKTSSGLREKDREEAPKKYMVLKLVDLKWEIDLFLFNSGFDRFWKLTPGTLVAILNPTIMPPPPGCQDTGRFSLVINSGEDTILEIGTARDLGYCKSIKKDGQPCNAWVNKKRTEYCEFHMNNALSKKKLARQDLNAFNTGLGPGSLSSRRQHNSRDVPWNSWEKKKQPPNPSGAARNKSNSNYDFETHSQYFVSQKSAATMLDNEFLPGQVAERIERGEALKRRLAKEEKERDMMKKLSSVGSGAGKEYMQLGQQKKRTGASHNPLSGDATRGTSSSSVQAEGEARQVDAQSLGLLPAKGKQQPKVHLSPIKRKRLAGGFTSSSASSSAATLANPEGPSSKVAIGWGSGLKDRLARMKEGAAGSMPNSSQSEEFGTMNSIKSDTSTETQQPMRKKTRFITEKGIREAGRDSLGGEKGALGGGKDGAAMVMLGDSDEDDEDELVILR